jgi:hypothetical protein
VLQAVGADVLGGRVLPVLVDGQGQDLLRGEVLLVEAEGRGVDVGDGAVLLAALADDAVAFLLLDQSLQCLDVCQLFE